MGDKQSWDVPVRTSCVAKYGKWMSDGQVSSFHLMPTEGPVYNFVSCAGHFQTEMNWKRELPNPAGSWGTP